MPRRWPTVEMPKVSETTPAPHRYTWDGANDVDGWFKVEDGEAKPSLREFLNAAPYKKGDVIYVVWGSGFALAYVSEVFHDYDQCGDRRHKYRVHRANQRGDVFSRNFYYVWPGQVQRGYTRAGLAPDCEGKV